jgi:ankyrin repeat protein
MFLCLSIASVLATVSLARAFGDDAEARYREIEIAKRCFIKPEVARLAVCAACGDVQQIDQLVSQGVDPDARAKNGMTPLIWAMQANNKAGFVRLLARGAKVDYLVPRRESTTLPAPVSRSLIGIAAANPTDSEWLLILLKQSANPNLVYPKIGNDDVTDLGAGMTPLFNAVQSGRTENVDLLLRYGAQINHQDNGGVTPLIFAASTCLDFKMALHLLKAGADYRIRSNNGESFAYHAVCGEVLAKDVISFLEQHGVSMAEARAKLAKEKKEEKARRGIRCQEPITQSVPDTLSSPIRERP